MNKTIQNIVTGAVLGVLVAFSGELLASDAADRQFQEVIADFIPEYKALAIPELQLSYEENFKRI